MLEVVLSLRDERVPRAGGPATRPGLRSLVERGVWVDHRGDGTAHLTARLASEDAEKVYSVLRACALADRNGDPIHDGANLREPLGLWLAAALVDLILNPRSSTTPSP